MMTAETATRLAAYIAEHGGATLTADGDILEPADGFAVGVAPGSAAVLPATADGPTIAATLARVAEEWQARFVGAWADGPSLYLDPVRILTDRETALRVGREHAQRAIYSFADRQAIELESIAY